MSERRVGRFVVGREWWEDREFASSVLRLCVPVRVELRWDMDGFDITAYGEVFEPVPALVRPGDYILRVRAGHGRVPALLGFAPGGPARFRSYGSG